MSKLAIEFQNVSKVYPNVSQPALEDISFQIYEGEFITILGSSGSGKTTALKMMNRLLEPSQGKVLFYEQDVQTMNAIALRRQIGYVVQQIALFPHMSVAQNIATVPQLLKWPTNEIEARVDSLLELVELEAEDYRFRYPKELSGGQQQRVGLARALAANPKVMLLDEPFGAVDAITRLNLQTAIEAIHTDLKDKTFILVTHDINEAFRLGHRVMFMNEGHLHQFDSPKNIIENPATDFVADLIQTAQDQERFWSDYHA